MVAHDYPLLQGNILPYLTAAQGESHAMRHFIMI
jgi:hypothetical protein